MRRTFHDRLTGVDLEYGRIPSSYGKTVRIEFMTEAFGSATWFDHLSINTLFRRGLEPDCNLEGLTPA